MRPRSPASGNLARTRIRRNISDSNNPASGSTPGSGRSNEDGKRIDRRFVNPQLEINGVEKDYTNGEYGPQVCTDFICDFIDTNKKKPFLVYYPMILTHCPFDPTPDSTDWDPKRLGSTTYKGDREDPQRHFVDMVAYADKAVGQIVAQLEKIPECATTR